VLLQPEEQRSRPWCASNLSRDSRKRTEMCALPRETVIEHEHLIGSALPLPNQPGSRFQFDRSTPPDLSGFVELLCSVAELALALRAEPAERDFLQAVCDGAKQQLAAEMRGCVELVENAPLLTKLAERELGEARERLPANRNISNRAAHACSGRAMRYTRPRSSCAEARVSPSFFFRVPEKRPRTVCRCHPIALATSSTVAPSGRRSIAMTLPCFDGRFASDCGSGSGKASIAVHS